MPFRCLIVRLLLQEEFFAHKVTMQEQLQRELFALDSQVTQPESCQETARRKKRFCRMHVLCAARAPDSCALSQNSTICVTAQVADTWLAQDVCKLQHHSAIALW